MSGIFADETDTLDVGTKLREIRLGRRLTLREVSARADISEGFLSQIELGRNSPSLKTFRRIAAALGVDAADVLENTDSELPRLVHRLSGRALEIGAVSKFRISPPGMTSVEVLKGEIRVGGDAGDTYTHGDSDEVLIVMAGTVVATVGDSDFEMSAGDTLCYRSSMPHSIRNEGLVPAEVIWVTSPPA